MVCKNTRPKVLELMFGIGGVSNIRILSRVYYGLIKIDDLDILYAEYTKYRNIKSFQNRLNVLAKFHGNSEIKSRIPPIRKIKT